MKLFVVIASLLVTIKALPDEEEWMEFKQNYSKTYKSLREDKLRFELFKSNLRTVNEHNERFEEGEESYTMKANQFADLTPEEFAETYLGYKKLEPNDFECFEIPANYTASESVDWRRKGAVLSVRNQRNCGSCWAFSAVGALEGQNAIKHNIKVELCEQELVDCSQSYGNNACRGGVVVYSFKYVQDNGIAAGSDYPYVATSSTCMKSSKSRANIKVTGFKKIDASERALQAAVDSVGPISVAIAAKNIQLYNSGIFDDPHCGTNLNHAVLAVGYGSAGGKDFWMVKNSWGSSWGENGYIRMSRNKNNQCGIASQASYPIIA